MVAPTPVGTPTQAIDSTGAATTITVDKPAGLTDGEVLVVNVTMQSSVSQTVTSWTMPAGFVQAADNDANAFGTHAALFVKPISDAASEPASYTFTMNGTAGQLGDMTAICARWQDADTSNPIEATSIAVNSNSSIITCPSVTTTAPDATYIGGGAQQRSGSISSSDLTMVGSVSSANDVLGNRSTGFMGYVTVPTAGETGTKAFTSSASRDYTALSFALRAAGGSPPPPPPTETSHYRTSTGTWVDASAPAFRSTSDSWVS